MKITSILLGLISLLILAPPVIAQDQLHKKNKEVIQCKVKEIGMDEIKYSLPDYPPDLLFSIDKDNVEKVIFENGQEMEFQKEISNPANYLDDYRNAIKVDFLSPLTGNTTFYYEHSRKPGRSLEAGLGIIGLGINVGDWSAKGAFIKFGPKFIKSPDFYMRGMRYSHILKGGYIKPEITLGLYSRKFSEWEDDGYYGNYVDSRKNVFMGAILLNVGKQWIFDNSFLVDFYFGVGYGFDSGDQEEGYHFGFVMASEDVPISFSAGLKIGGLFK